MTAQQYNLNESEMYKSGSITHNKWTLLMQKNEMKTSYIHIKNSLVFCSLPND